MSCPPSQTGLAQRMVAELESIFCTRGLCGVGGESGKMEGSSKLSAATYNQNIVIPENA